MTPDTKAATAIPKVSILKPVLVYFVAASAWIWLSDRAVGWLFSDPSAMGFASSLKGWLFVAVTSGLLFWLLARQEKWTQEADAAPGPSGSAPKALPIRLVFLALVLVVPLIGVAFYQTQRPRIEAEASKNLQAIARLKAEQIERWLMDRDGDAQILKDSVGLGQQIAALSLGKADATTRQALLGRFQVWQKSYGYASVLVLDRSGHLLLAQGAHQEMPPISRDLSAQAFASKQVQRGQMYRDDEGDIHLEWVVPVLAAAPQGELAVAAVLLRTRATDYLYPLINTWPVASDTGESQLVRPDGDAAIYLNDLRHRPGSALVLRFDLGNLSLPGASAVRTNEPGTMQGVDYHGASVLAAYQPVVGTDWHVVTKVDRAEVLAPLWRSLYWVTLMAMAAVAAIMLALWLFLQQLRRAQQLALLAEKSKADRLLATLIDNSTDAIFIKDLHGRYTMANPEVARVMGISLPELLGQDDAALFPGHAQAIQAHDRRVMSENKLSTLEEGVNSVDGVRTYLSTKGPLHDESGQVIGLFGISRDITGRKRAEEALKESENRFRNLLKNIPSVAVQGYREDGTACYWNQASERLYGYSADEALGRNLLELIIPAEMRDGVRGAMREMFQTTTPIPAGELSLLRKNGSRVDVFSSHAYVHVPGLSPEMFCVDIDITERKQAQARLAEQLDELRRWQKAMLGREGRILSIKKEVNDLLAEHGQPPRYASAVAGENDT